MEAILNYLYEHCIEDESCIRSYKENLYFSFANFNVIICYSGIEEELLEGAFRLSEVDFTLFQSEHLKEVRIESTVSLDSIEDGVEKSLSWQMYFLLQKIGGQFGQDSIAYYNIGTLCVDDGGGGCAELYEYGYQIKIAEQYRQNLDFYRFLMTGIKWGEDDCDIPDFYGRFVLKDNSDVKILPSNTKLRRLGYFKLLLKMLEERPVPFSQLNQRFERYCQEYNEALEGYKNSKGNVVVTKTGNSAKPYTEMALNLGLIHHAAGICEVGKFGKVYNILKERTIEDNPFALSKYDVVFFLELLLKEDFCFLFVILEEAYINPNPSYTGLRGKFKELLLERINSMMSEVEKGNMAKILKLKLVAQRIKEWKKPEVYMEHVLMPRLNWLYDLNLINLKDNLSYDLSESGTRLFRHLVIWNDLGGRKIVSSIVFLNKYYLKMVNSVFAFNKPFKGAETFGNIQMHLDESFRLFRTLAPNRVTFSLFASYTKLMMFWHDEGCCDTEDLKEVFEQRQLPGYIYKYQEHYKDGYIERK